MEYQIKTQNRTSNIQILHKNESFVHVLVDVREYKLDIQKVEEGIYSILYKNKSIEMELVKNTMAKKFHVSHRCLNYQTEVIDAQSRYIQNRKGNKNLQTEKQIIAPMPGKVVKVLVNEGQEVNEGQALVIISAMKMENEFSASTNGKVKKIHIQEGDSVESQQILIELA